jgi:hypothetical protein
MNNEFRLLTRKEENEKAVELIHKEWDLDKEKKNVKETNNDTDAFKRMSIGRKKTRIKRLKTAYKLMYEYQIYYREIRHGIFRLKAKYSKQEFTLFAPSGKWRNGGSGKIYRYNNGSIHKFFENILLKDDTISDKEENEGEKMSRRNFIGNLSKNQILILVAMSQGETLFANYNGTAGQTGLDRNTVKRNFESLKRRGVFVNNHVSIRALRRELEGI